MYFYQKYMLGLLILKVSFPSFREESLFKNGSELK